MLSVAGDDLLRTVGDRLRGLSVVTELVVPFDRGDVLASLHREGEVLVETATDDDFDPDKAGERDFGFVALALVMIPAAWIAGRVDAVAIAPAASGLKTLRCPPRSKSNEFSSGTQSKHHA